MARSLRPVILASAGIFLLTVALTSCGSTRASQSASGPSPSPSPATTTSAGIAGYKWAVVSIAHNAVVTPIPARYEVYLTFGLDGEYSANDPINTHGGSYHETAGGFTISDGAVSAVGYIGHDPVTVLAIQALDSLDTAAATTALTGDSLKISVNHGEWVLTCQRDGEQPSAARATETGFVGYKWTVTAISEGGPTAPVPARDDVYMAFTRDGQFVANEPVNTHGGPYWVTPSGFTTEQVTATLALGGARDSGGGLAIQAFDALSTYAHPATHATVDITGNVMVVRENGFTLTCRRDGAFSLPPAQSSSPPPSA